MLIASQYESTFTTLPRRSHCNACHAIRGIPEAHGATVGTALRRNPRHDEKQDLDHNEQAYCNIPSLELGPFDSELAALAADQINTDCHGEEEHGLWVVLEIDNCE